MAVLEFRATATAGALLDGAPELELPPALVAGERAEEVGASRLPAGK